MHKFKKLFLSTGLALSLGFGISNHTITEDRNNQTIDYQTNSQIEYIDLLDNMGADSFYDDNETDDKNTKDNDFEIDELDNKKRKKGKDKKNEEWPEEDKRFDYCKITKDSDAVDKILATKLVPDNILFEGDLEAIEQLEINLEDIVHADIENITFDRLAIPETYNIIFVPIGYENEDKIEKRMEGIIDVVDSAYQGVSVDFSYLKFSVPVGVGNIERLPLILDYNEPNTLLDKIQMEYPAHTMMFVVNSNIHLGSAGRYGIMSGESMHPAYLSIHEAGHLLGLGDGYKRYYGKSRINGTELFTDIKKVSPITKRAYDLLLPDIVEVDGVCNGKQVHSFYENGTDIMDRFYSNYEVLRWVKNDQPLFNDMQIVIMCYTIDKKLDD